MSTTILNAPADSIHEHLVEKTMIDNISCYVTTFIIALFGFFTMSFLMMQASPGSETPVECVRERREDEDEEEETENKRSTPEMCAERMSAVRQWQKESNTKNTW